MTSTRPGPQLRDARGGLLGREEQGWGEGMFTYSTDEEEQAVRIPHGWGPWELDPGVLVLRRTDQADAYEVDLEWCLDSAQVLDWICQIAHKDRADHVAITGLVNALDDVLHPQRNLCSGGEPGQITTAQLRELALAAQARQQQGLAVYGRWWEAADASP